MNKKISMNVQPIVKRKKNFSEVILGWNKKQATQQALRCPQCTHPACIAACPLGIDIPVFIRIIREGDFSKALQKIREDNGLAGICGRLCSAPCEKACFLNKESHSQPIAIRSLERAAFDFGNVRLQEIFNAKASNKTQKRVAIIGSGPTGLMAAANLIEDGHDVMIFEALHQPGGFLRYACPELRLPRKVLDADVDYIKSLGVALIYHTPIGQQQTIEEFLTHDFHAVLVATGLCLKKDSDVVTHPFQGVMGAQEFLFRMNLALPVAQGKPAFSLRGENVVILGSGFEAMDCARLALRLGKKVVLVHAGAEEDLPFTQEEKTLAQEEGLVWEGFAQAMGFVQNNAGALSGVRCQRLDFADQDGKWVLLPVKNSDFVIDADSAILTGRYQANLFAVQADDGLKFNKQGFLAVKKDQHATGVKGVFVAGGAAQGVLPLVQALAQGKSAAQEIDAYLQQK